MRLSVFLLAAVLLGFLCLNAEWLVAHDPAFGEPFRRLDLVPYILLVALAALWPLALMARHGWFSILHPVVHVGWTYVAPVLVAGSLLFVLVGVSDTPDTMILDPAADYRVALLYLASGLAALGLGATMRRPRVLAQRFGRTLPALEWRSGECVAAGAALMLVGTLFQYANFRAGLIGYQFSKGGAFAALFFYLGLSFQMGIFLLWFGIFRAESRRAYQLAAAALFLACILFVAVLSGSRGLLVSCWIVMVLACIAAAGWPSQRRVVLLGLAGCIMLAGGFTVGTLFRQAKSTVATPSPVAQLAPVPVPHPVSPRPTTAGPVPAQEPPIETSEDLARFAQREVTLGDQAAIVREALQTAGSGSAMPVVLRSFAARLNVLTQVTVLVSQREALLQSMPPSLRNGIVNGIATALIPRAFWPGKPIIGDTAAHARLFFRFDGNAFAITPIGDLLLNFGPAGIVPGMVLLGILMSALHGALVGAYPASGARAAVMLALLTQFSVEGFFAPIIPGIIRAGAVGVAGVLLAHAVILVVRRAGREAKHRARDGRVSSG